MIQLKSIKLNKDIFLFCTEKKLIRQAMPTGKGETPILPKFPRSHIKNIIYEKYYI